MSRKGKYSSPFFFLHTLLYWCIAENHSLKYIAIFLESEKENMYSFPRIELVFNNIDKEHVLAWATIQQTKIAVTKFSSLFKAEPVYEGRLKVILLLQVGSHGFEPTFISFCLN